MSITFKSKGIGVNMLSNDHRQKLSAWLLAKNYSQFFSQLKLQKFLFFYEAFSKVRTGDADFSSLKAYKNGPVYSDIYGDYVYRQMELVNTLDKLNFTDEVNEEIAIVSNRVVSILNEKELSEFTHELNMWNTHEKLIQNQTLHIPMYEHDFNETDMELVGSLWEMYSGEFYDNMEIFTVNTANFIMDKGLKEALNAEQEKALLKIADAGLPNPIYVSINEDGVLEID